MLVLHLRLRVCVGALLIEVGVITLLHLGQLFTFLLLSCLHLGLLTLVVRRSIRYGLRRGRSRLRLRQVLGMDGDRSTRAARTYDVRLESTGPAGRGNRRFAVIHRSDELRTCGRALAMLYLHSGRRNTVLVCYALILRARLSR